MDKLSTPKDRILLHLYLQRVFHQRETLSLDELLARSCGHDEFVQWLQALTDLVRAGDVAQAKTHVYVFITDSGMLKGYKIRQETG